VFGYVARCQRDHQDLITLDPVAYGEPGARLCAKPELEETRRTLCSAADPVSAAASATLQRRRGQLLLAGLPEGPSGLVQGERVLQRAVSAPARVTAGPDSALWLTRCRSARGRPVTLEGLPRRRERQVLYQPVVPRQRQRRQRRAVRVHLLALGVRDARGALQRVQLPQQPGAPAASAPRAWISPMR